jgi:hypothetical protein
LFFLGNNLEFFSLITFFAALSLGMFSGYWVATALSTPDRMCHVVPLASLFRRLPR